ncbi:hypothetical protein E1301_Tti012956 [Triplophysa tibetana]|uniref:Ig-like domain-containing protein n=1 Tax=Triplophysa tibetana TaxID=1572043 RepID=A0A5A9NSK2_9TELE|nr:hypothetical protein E1301_Tti012956 [Triplophysa tibetana]
MCSADNGADVSLSWFKNNERLNQTSSPDLNISLSLSLEIKERNNTYYCVAANPVKNLTTQLNFQEHCPQHTVSSVATLDPKSAQCPLLSQSQLSPHSCPKVSSVVTLDPKSAQCPLLSRSQLSAHSCPEVSSVPTLDPKSAQSPLLSQSQLSAHSCPKVSSVPTLDPKSAQSPLLSQSQLSGHS